MKTVSILACCLAVAFCAPADTNTPQILSYENNNDGLGNYNFRFETSDGISRQEEGVVLNAGDPDSSSVVRGKYSYIGPDGVTYTVTYIADENGFQPQGAHLPGNNEISEPEPPIVAALPPNLIASLVG